MTTTLGPAPRRAAGIQLHGQYQGSGYREPRYLVVRIDGQAVHLTRMLYLALQALNGVRSTAEAAAMVSSHLDRELTEDGLLSSPKPSSIRWDYSPMTPPSNRTPPPRRPIRCSGFGCTPR